NFAANYGFGPWGGSYGYEAIGRGGECFYFADLVLWRASLPGAPKLTFPIPSYAALASQSQSNLQMTHEGDIIFSSSVPHVAIVVEIKRDGSNNVASLDLIDANWLSDTGGPWREVIGRHNLSVSYLQS